MVDTLAKMQAAGLVDEEEELTTPDEAETELVLEEDAEPEAVVAEEEAGATIELQDDTQGRPSVEVPKRTLSELRRTRREAREQVSQKDAQLEEMRQQLQNLQQATLKKPQYADYPDDASYEAALLQYHSVASQGQPQAQPQPTAQPQVGPDFSEQINAHIDRAEKLGVSADEFLNAEDTVRSVLGNEVTDALIAAVGPGSEKAIMVMGSRAQELQRVQQLLANDRTGLSVVSHVTRLGERARVNKKTISGAPAPTRSPSGGGHIPSSDAEYEKQMAKLEKAKDAQGMFELRRARRKAAAS